MNEASGGPKKHVPINSSSRDGLKVPVNVRGPQPLNKQPIPQKERTLSDYVPPTIEDPQMDKAIDDIVMSESNEMLAAEDSIYQSNNPTRQKKKPKKIIRILKSKWLYIGLAVVIAALFIVPFSRYQILGLFIKKDYQFSVIDSVTNTPVSGAIVSAGYSSVITNASGQASLKIPVGKQKYTIFKRYYAEASGSIFVGLSKSKNTSVDLVATGREVSVTIINKLSNKPLSGVKISVLNTNATTNALGQAEITLPTKKAYYTATVNEDSFNTLVTPIQVTTSKNANVIRLVPTGSVYYLSNSGGNINVIKSNLDGSNPTVLLAGTGSETSSTTILSPSPDWKYLVLEAKRSGSQPELYLINTSTGSYDEFDSSAATFNVIGWSNDQFIYDEVSTGQPTSSVGREEIKSFNATNNQLNVLDENQVLGSAPSYAYQSFSNFELLPSLLVYTTSWTSVNSYDLSNANDTIRSVEPNGLNKKDYSTFPASTTGAMSVVRNEPESLYFSVNNNQTNQISYYSFSNGSVSPSSIAAESFAQDYPTYYISPSGVASLWTTKQGNPIETMTGNQNGQNVKKVLVPTGYNAYGWYDNVYILLSKSGQLYISPATGSNSPILIGSYLPSS